MITVITREPLVETVYGLIRQLILHPRSTARNIIARKRTIGGHKAVTRSLIQGLKNIKRRYKYDPIIASSIKGEVIVLSGVGALRICIKRKQQGKISKLLAGPNIMVRADDYEGLYGSEAIDRILVPAEWVKYSYEYENPSTKGKLVIWPAGIDPVDWTPKSNHTHSLLLYKKMPKNELKNGFYEDLSGTLGQQWDLIELEYGDHTQADYKKALSQVEAMIYIAKSESQGIALLEAWAMDVPTFVWESDFKREGKRIFKDISCAPYLSSQTGKFWKTKKQLISILSKSLPFAASPRNWVIQNMTDTIVAHRILDIIGKIDSKETER